MEIEIDTESITPVYEQIAQQVKAAVLNGTLPVGTSMPVIRQLARDLAVNHNTVAKAYRLLELQRVTQSAGRNGTRIHDRARMNILHNNTEDARYKLDELLNSFEEKGMSASDIRALLETQIMHLKKTLLV
ncbi:MAG: GntR family transcriptional regulator [Kordiimonadales bacterium]|nr:MAG: GntR family transcriptional regulator [Kordiimonadales bacterium]